MFTFDKKKKYTAWVNFSDDEKYLIEYWPPKEYVATKAGKIDIEFSKRIVNWDGIFVDIDGEKTPLECSVENKKELFVTNIEAPDVAERGMFLLSKMTSPETFFNADEKKKN